MTNYVKLICEAHEMQYISSRKVSGGDINETYSVGTNKGLFFMKLNSASNFPLMFKKEAEGLKALQQASLLKAPEVIATGECQGQQYLLLEWLEKTLPNTNFWQQFAEGIAQLHRITHSHFGWTSSNYIGSLMQPNEYKTSWQEFYSTQRIMPLIEQLYNNTYFLKSDVQAAEKVCACFKDVFPDEPPALLHGDLWAGNFMVVQSIGIKNNSEVLPSVFDPAVYFGNREMDLGMSLLFGGFDKRFYEIYHSIFPIENSWRKRVFLTQLYPLLVHAVLFKGGYINQCRNILNEWK